ncbi:MAG: hypothetical protein ACK55I_22405, partial [bacterium]
MSGTELCRQCREPCLCNDDAQRLGARLDHLGELRINPCCPSAATDLIREGDQVRVLNAGLHASTDIIDPLAFHGRQLRSPRTRTTVRRHECAQALAHGRGSLSL